MEAFSYDTLVSSGEQEKYNKVISRTNAFMNAGIAIGSLTGGFLYSIWLPLPFLLTGITKFLAFGVSLFIDEPEVDTDKFSLRNFISQTKKGLVQLLSRQLRNITIMLITFNLFFKASYEILDDITIIDFGYTAEGIGIIYAISTIIAIPMSLLYEKLSKKFSLNTLIYLGIFAVALQYILTPWVGVVVWTGLYFLNIAIEPIRENAISQLLNEKTDSKIRATTLSTYSMFKVLPFVLLTGVIGAGAEKYGIREFDSYFFILMLVLVVPQMFLIKFAKRNPLNKDL